MTRGRKWLLAVLVVLVVAGLSVVVPGSPTRDFASGARHAECTTWFGHNDGRTLAAYGDSITEADSRPRFGLQGERSWYSHLVCPGTFAHAGNEGASGETSEQVAARLADDDPTADVIVIAAGTNDLRDGLPTEETIGHLDRALEAALEGSEWVMLATVQPWTSTDAGPLNEAIRELAAQRGVTVVDFAAVLGEEGATVDGVHPTVESARVLAETVAAAAA